MTREVLVVETFTCSNLSQTVQQGTGMGVDIGYVVVFSMFCGGIEGAGRHHDMSHMRYCSLTPVYGPRYFYNKRPQDNNKAILSPNLDLNKFPGFLPPNLSHL